MRAVLSPCFGMEVFFFFFPFSHSPVIGPDFPSLLMHPWVELTLGSSLAFYHFC